MTGPGIAELRQFGLRSRRRAAQLPRENICEYNDLMRSRGLLAGSLRLASCHIIRYPNGHGG